MFRLFIQGGPAFMAVLTVLLAAIFFAAWKAPRWIKEIGCFALVFGSLSFLLGLRNMFVTLRQAPDIAPGVLYGGFSVALIPVIYGIIIYLISLVIRIITKPRV